MHWRSIQDDGGVNTACLGDRLSACQVGHNSRPLGLTLAAGRMGPTLHAYHSPSLSQPR